MTNFSADPIRSSCPWSAVGVILPHLEISRPPIHACGPDDPREQGGRGDGDGQGREQGTFRRNGRGKPICCRVRRSGGHRDRRCALFEEVQARTRELSPSLDDLRAAQDRLVQTEKLASLGQLTAGIAHEIKNPLNFINNFSALSVELTDELNDVLSQAELAEKFSRRSTS